MRIIINGVGIAGPTLAYWLAKDRHEVTLVEEAPHLRSGGYIIDFWGVGYDIAERMHLIPRIKELGYQVKDVRIVGKHGNRSGGFSVEALGRLTRDRFTSLRRSDLAATIYEALDGRVETIFGDSIAHIESRANRVCVGFDRAASRTADLVVGADGLHSRVRALAFGPDARFDVSLGYHVAAFEVEGYRPRDELVYVTHNVPGRQIARFSMRDDRTLFLFVFRDDYLPAGDLSSEHERKLALMHVFAGIGWECPRILEAMQTVTGMYFDGVSQVHMPRWTTGRTALIGDAAACVSLLAGEGTGLAMAEAYILAGELRACRGDHLHAFTRYERRMMPLLVRKQASARTFASSLVPSTTVGIGLRNLVTRLFHLPYVADLFIGRALRDEFTLR